MLPAKQQAQLHRRVHVTAVTGTLCECACVRDAVSSRRDCPASIKTVNILMSGKRKAETDAGTKTAQRPRRKNEHQLPCVTCHKTGDRNQNKIRDFVPATSPAVSSPKAYSFVYRRRGCLVEKL